MCYLFIGVMISNLRVQLLNHSETLLSAFTARVSALLAILKLFRITLALFSTRITNDGAGMTKQRCVFTADTHQGGIGRTNNRALSRKGNTPRKHFDIVFLEALGSTMFAF